MLAVGSPELSELALVLADSFPETAGLPPNDFETKMGVSYLTRENPLFYICDSVGMCFWYYGL